MPSEDNKVLRIKQYQKSGKALLINYADLEFLIEKIDGCKNYPENLFTIKVSGHFPSVFSMLAISSLKCIENKHDI